MPGSTDSEPLVEVKRLRKSYRQTRWFSQQRFVIPALDDVNLAIREGSTLALVGESGSGKSTLARCLALLERPSSGEIWIDGVNVLTLPDRQLARARPQIQLIFQDPATSFDPVLKIAEVVAEPLDVQHQVSRARRPEMALRLMEDVDLPPEWADRLPLELSGGERQRLALARALAMRPKVLILDEVFSGLDLPLQAQIAKLLSRLKERWRLTYVLVSHDLGVVCRMADQVAVLYRGRLVEHGNTAQLFSRPKHPHTRALVSAALSFEPRFHRISG